MKFRTTLFVAAICLIQVFAVPVWSRTDKESSRTDRESLEPLDFVKRFRIGMSYTDVADSIPKNANRDVLSYSVPEDLFIFTVEMPGQGEWTVTFTFDTEDSPIRRPERLVEVRCSAMLSSRKQPFDSLVQTVSTSFGDPVKLERAKSGQRQAGWKMTGGSVLLLEYSVLPGAAISVDAVVDFIVRSKNLNTPGRLIARA